MKKKLTKKSQYTILKNKKPTKKSQYIGGNSNIQDLIFFLKTWSNEVINPKTDGTIEKIKNSYLLYFMEFKECIETYETEQPTIINLINENIDIINQMKPVNYNDYRSIDYNKIDEIIDFADECLDFLKKKITKENVTELYTRILIFHWCLKYTSNKNLDNNPIYEALHYIIADNYTKKANENEYIGYGQLILGYPILQGYLLLYKMIVDKLTKELKKFNNKTANMTNLYNKSREVSTYINGILQNADKKKFKLNYKLPLDKNHMDSLEELNHFIKNYSYCNTNGSICELSRSQCVEHELDTFRPFGKIHFSQLDGKIGLSIQMNDKNQLDIISCDPDSIAKDKGILVGDMINRIYVDGKNVLIKGSNPEDIYEILTNKRPIELKIMRTDKNSLNIKDKNYKRCHLLSDKCRQLV